MPYSGISDPATIAKLDDCVTKVMATGKDKSSAIAICRASMNKELQEDDVSRQDRAKAKRNRAAKQAATIKDLSELGQAFGWSEKDVKASYPWDSCIADQMKKYGSRTRAEKICGAIRANAGKALSDERIATVISLSPVTAPNFRAKADAKGITDAPNLRGEDAQCCANCQYYKPLPDGIMDMPMMQSEPPDDSGICTKYDFEADCDWVCDAWQAIASPDVAGAIADAAQAIADATDAMGAMPAMTDMGKDAKTAYPWDQCIADQMKRYGDRATAEKVCGSIRAGKSLAEAEAELGVKALTDEAKDAPPGHEFYGNQYGGGGGGGGSSESAPKAPSRGYANAREEITAVRHRLATGNLKRGERQLLQKREEELARTILGVKAVEMGMQKVAAQTIVDIFKGARISPSTTGVTEAQLNAQGITFVHSAGEMLYKDSSPLTLFKQADGRLRVVGWASNNRRDKDNPPEIITEAAHKEFMAYLDAHPEHAPEFWHWHTPGTKYAKADWWDYADGFTVYSGLVDAGKEAQAEKAAAEGIGMSHGFHVLGYDNANHHITQYRTFEVSDLPKSRAANPYTSFSTIRKEASMAFSEAKKAYLLERLPAETVAELERKTSDLKAAADAAGIEAKDMEETPVVEAATPTAEKADSKPTDKPATVAADGGDAKPKMDMTASDMMQMVSDMIDKKMAAMGKDVGEAVGVSIKTLIERVGTAEETAAKAQTAAEQAAQTAQKSLDDMVAELISPAPLRKGYRASAAADTRVPAKKQDGIETPAAKAVEEPTLPGSPADWWTKEVMKPAGLA